MSKHLGPPSTGDDPPEGWLDLAANRPGTSARAQADLLASSSPVWSLFASVLGLYTEEGAWRVGAEGEERLGRRLARRLGPGWHVLHAVPIGRRGADIDHLAIGPAGVFTVNTKNHGSGSVRVAPDGLFVNGRLTDYLAKARLESSACARILSAACGFLVTVRPVVAVFSSRIRVDGQPPGVHVLQARDVPSWLRRQPPQLALPAVEQLFAAARRDTTWHRPRPVPAPGDPTGYGVPTGHGGRRESFVRWTR